MENGDFHRFLETLFNVKTFRGFDIFEVDASEGRLEQLDRLDHLVRVFRIQLDVKNVNIGESFEQNGLAFHDGLCGQRADVAQPQYGCAIGDDRYEVSLCGIVEYLSGITMDLPAGLGDSGRVRHRKISLSKTWFCRFDFDFSGSLFAVVFKSVTFPNHVVLLVAEFGITARVSVKKGSLFAPGSDREQAPAWLWDPPPVMDR